MPMAKSEKIIQEGSKATENLNENGTSESSQQKYDHFLFIRHNPKNGAAATDTLVMVNVTPDGFELKDKSIDDSGGRDESKYSYFSHG